MEYKGTNYLLIVTESDFKLDVKEIPKYDGMIFVFSAELKQTFDDMMLYFIKIQAANVFLIPRIVICNKIDKYNYILEKEQYIS